MAHAKIFSILALCAVVLLPASAHAQNKRNERAQDRRELRQDKRQTRDDRRDLIQLQKLLGDFDRARRSGHRAGLRDVDRRLQGIMRQETKEGRRELRQDRREVKRSKREARTDQRGRRDDRRDLRDDRRDRNRTAKRQQRRQEIRKQLAGLYGNYNPRGLAKKRKLIVELIRLAEAEQRENRREIREDRRELREDRRR